MKQTPVEWLFNQMSNVAAGYVTELNEQEILDKAKEMEKQQMVEFTQNYVFECVTCSYDGIPDPLKEAEQYYNETFKSE